MYVRYKQLRALVDMNDTRLNRLNLIGFVLGCGSSLGMCVVANFQVRNVCDVLARKKRFMLKRMFGNKNVQFCRSDACKCLCFVRN